LAILTGLLIADGCAIAAECWRYGLLALLTADANCRLLALAAGAADCWRRLLIAGADGWRCRVLALRP